MNKVKFKDEFQALVYYEVAFWLYLIITCVCIFSMTIIIMTIITIIMTIKDIIIFFILCITNMIIYGFIWHNLCSAIEILNDLKAKLIKKMREDKRS